MPAKSSVLVFVALFLDLNLLLALRVLENLLASCTVSFCFRRESHRRKRKTLFATFSDFIFTRITNSAEQLAKESDVQFNFTLFIGSPLTPRPVTLKSRPAGGGCLDLNSLPAVVT